MAGVSGMLDAGCLFPFPLRNFREERRAAFDLGMDAREVNVGGKGERLGVDLPSSDDADLVRRIALRERNGIVQGMDDVAPENRSDASRDDDVPAIREWFANGLVRLPPHNDVFPLRDFPKMLEIIGQVPWETPILPDDVIFRCGSNEADLHVTTLSHWEL